MDCRPTVVETRGALYYRFNLKTRLPLERDCLINSLRSVVPIYRSNE